MLQFMLYKQEIYLSNWYLIRTYIITSYFLQTYIVSNCLFYEHKLVSKTNFIPYRIMLKNDFS